MLRACLLAVIAGYADTVGYLRFDAFAGLMTGNTIFLGVELATLQLAKAAFHATIIAVFLGGVLVSRALVHAGFPIWGALTITAGLHVACSFLDPLWAAPLLALAMGMQNAAATRFGGVALNTVFVTGNLQKLGEGIVAWCMSSLGRPGPRTDGVAIFGLVWLSYALGAGLGATGNAFMAHPLLVPAAVLPFIYAPFLERRSTGAPARGDARAP